MDNVAFFIDRKEVQKIILTIIGKERSRGHNFINFGKLQRNKEKKQTNL